MTEETKATCLKILERVFNQEQDDMFGAHTMQPAPPWKPAQTIGQTDQGVTVRHITPPQTMTMRKFCHYLFTKQQDVMLAIVQTHRKLRRKANATHPYVYSKGHDQAAVADLIKEADKLNITISGDLKQQRESYKEYRAEHLNYKSCAKKINIPAPATNIKPLPTVTAATNLDGIIQVANKLIQLEAAKKEAAAKAKKIDEEVADDLTRQAEAHKKLKDIETEQRELACQLAK